MKSKRLVLESGEVFDGIGFGAQGSVSGEIVFNTSMVGYQEIISDPAYAGQIVVMTYPPMGQYGITDEDSESRFPAIAGLVVREYCDTPSNFRYTKTLSEEMSEHGVTGLSEIDTRMLTRTIRDKGCMKAAIVDGDTSVEDALKLISSSAASGPESPVAKASCSKRWFRRTPQHKFDVVVIDCGLKYSLIDALIARGCNVTVVPFNTTKEEIERFQPDGIVISSGPGDPRRLPELVAAAGELKGKYPLCGIALGHQILALTYGAEIQRMKAGHHGGRPVRLVKEERIVTVEHNHNFTVDLSCVCDKDVEILYEDVVDHSIEGIVCNRDKVISSQFYPEGAPGPKEELVLDTFVDWMKNR
ncbi:MAG: carbamoyl phosphate synthase small subunit [Bacteroidales bacterium]|nr:carbamoyl phosphate synthase small subunit [Candidatus Cacconaster merdequi]